MNLCVIPARGGSKRIPRKNIKLFGGLPMIAWSIRAALSSECFDQIIVSTDDEEIAGVASKYGAVVPFFRPDELADDYTGTIPVVAHAIKWFTDRNEFFSKVCCVYPTAPFMSSDDIRAGLALLEGTDADYVFPVGRFPSPIQRAVRINSAGRAEMFFPDRFDSRSQDLEEAYHDAGQFYWGKVGAWLSGAPIFNRNSVPLILPRLRAQDIDTPEDWSIAEIMFQYATNMRIS